jgi:transposase-like protein
MSERGLHLAFDTTILRWVQRYAPEFVKRWNRFGRPAGRSWQVDETYIKVRGQWTYLYQSRTGPMLDSRVSPRLQSPLPEWNCSVVFTNRNSP